MYSSRTGELVGRPSASEARANYKHKPSKPPVYLSYELSLELVNRIEKATCPQYIMYAGYQDADFITCIAQVDAERMIAAGVKCEVYSYEDEENCDNDSNIQKS